MGNHTLVAVDLAKTVFEVAVSTEPGRVSRRERLPRGRFLSFFAQLPKATVLMEACGSAHFWARSLQQLGHTPVLIPLQYVRPYVVRNKTDRTDAKGILEAHRNEEIRSVPVKTVAQHALGGLHRLRSAWLADRTARINTLRGLLRELGITIPLGAEHVVPAVQLHLGDADSEIPDSLRPALAEAAVGPRRRADHRHRSFCLRRGRAALSLRASLLQLPGPHTARALQRRKPSRGTNLQAWRRISAYPSHPRGAVRRPGCSAHERARSAPYLGPQTSRPPRSQPGRGGHGQQDGAHHLGRLADRAPLRIDPDRGVDRNLNQPRTAWISR